MNHLFFERSLTTFLRHETRRQLVLEGTNGAGLPAPRPGHEYLLYVHVPFCASLCPYCSFNRFLFKEELARTYFKRLRDEMRMAADLGYTFRSMYIGGGTPTILADELVKTIDLARELFGIVEVSCETNPNHLVPDIVDKLEGRVQRMSVGVQSFDDKLLKQMSRYDSIGPGRKTLGHLQSAVGRFPSLNVDMIFNFPSQTHDILRQDVEAAIASGANQVTFYPLMVSPSVAHALDHTIGRVDTTREASYYHLLCQELSRAFELSSAWTFSRTGGGMIDEYIVDYEEYMGLGSGAFSYLDGTLYVNTFSLCEYDKTIAAGRMSVSAARRFDLHQRMRYRFMMEMFGLKFDKRRFEQDLGAPVERGLWMEMAFLRLAGAFERNDETTLTLTPEGRYLLVVMMREFFSGVNTVRDQARAALAAEEQTVRPGSEKRLAAALAHKVTH